MRFIKSGLQTSVQDAGRNGYMHQGVPISGAMDVMSLQLANWLVSNSLTAPALEVTQVGPKIEFRQAMTVAVAGATFELELNQSPVNMHQSFAVQAGDVLGFGRLQQGCRAYLSVSAELDIPEVMSSFSTHLVAGYAGFRGRSMQNGDILPCKNTFKSADRQLPERAQRHFTGNYLIRCTKGLEFDNFSAGQQQAFFTQRWSVSAQSNRMGIRLQGQAISKGSKTDMLSTGLLPGSIQVPSAGQPIISAVEGQTIGGYPRIAQVIQADMPLLGQLKGGDKVSFRLIEVNKARLLKQQQNDQLSKLFAMK